MTDETNDQDQPQEEISVANIYSNSVTHLCDLISNYIPYIYYKEEARNHFTLLVINELLTSQKLFCENIMSVDIEAFKRSIWDTLDKEKNSGVIHEWMSDIINEVIDESFEITNLYNSFYKQDIDIFYSIDLKVNIIVPVIKKMQGHNSLCGIIVKNKTSVNVIPVIEDTDYENIFDFNKPCKSLRATTKSKLFNTSEIDSFITLETIDHINTNLNLHNNVIGKLKEIAKTSCLNNISSIIKENEDSEEIKKMPACIFELEDMVLKTNHMIDNDYHQTIKNYKEDIIHFAKDKIEKVANDDNYDFKTIQSAFVYCMNMNNLTVTNQKVSKACGFLNLIINS